MLQCERGCKGTGYICFKEAESVSLALELNKTLVLNREINVERYHSKKLGRGVNGNEASKKGPNKKFVPKGSSGKNKTTIDHSPKKKKKQEFIGAKSDKKKVNSSNYFFNSVKHHEHFLMPFSVCYFVEIPEKD